MLIRITKGVADKGRLVPPDQLIKTVTDRTKDWYYSPFTYGQDALEYWESNNKSLSGFAGKVSTDTLYWDIDVEDDLDKAARQTYQLCLKLADLGYEKGLEIYFSGSKGFHVLLRTTATFTPQETAKICYNVAREADCLSGFDTVVYNTNRIFRIPNTKHQKSGLYKIPIEPSELEEKTIVEIKALAFEPREIPSVSEPVDVVELIAKFGKVTETKAQNLKVYEGGALTVDDVDMSQVPKALRRCNYRLEQGLFGPGERENACYRIAALSKARGLDKDQTKMIVITALERRSVRYPDASDWKEQDVDRIVGEIYSENFRGGIFSCKPGMGQDQFLVDHCDLGEGCCAKQAEAKVMTMGIQSLIDAYKKYGDEALPEYPKFGVKFLDDNIRLRPRNFGILNGANGSGKTSLVTQLLDNLNKQKLHHIFFSADMADTSLLEKLGAKYTRYTQAEIEDAFSKYTTNKDAEKVKADVSEKLALALPYTIFDFTATLRTEYIKETIINTETHLGIKMSVAIVDYAGRMTNDFESAYQKATHNALEANSIAKLANVHLLIVSQVSREHGDHTTALRTSRVSKDSGAWEENATYVVNVWRPMGFDPSIDRYYHLFIGKNRGPGVSAEHGMLWDGKEGTIREMSDDEFADYTRLVEELRDDEAHKHRKLRVPYREGFTNPDDERRAMEKSGRFDFDTNSEDNKNTHDDYEEKERLPRREFKPRFSRDS